MVNNHPFWNLTIPDVIGTENMHSFEIESVLMPKHMLGIHTCLIPTKTVGNINKKEL